MRITIKDIAKECDISAATVSLVLNNKECRIPEDTRKKVKDMAAKMNYRPNKVAISLVTKKTKTIGLIVPDIYNLFFGELAKGVEERASEADYKIFLCNTNDKVAKDIDYVNALLDQGVDGVIIVMSSYTQKDEIPKCISSLIEAKKPYVIVDRVPCDNIGSTITIDNKLGGYLATNHLIEFGFKKIACVTGPIISENARHRLNGYLQALKDAGLPILEDGIFEGDYHTDSGYSLAEEIVNKGFEAVFACNDLMAYGVYKRLREMNLRVPDDISIVGFDDIFFSGIMETPLSTVFQPVYEMGNKAIELLIDMMDNEKELNEHIVFRPNLVLRKSVKQLRRTND